MLFLKGKKVNRKLYIVKISILFSCIVNFTLYSKEFPKSFFIDYEIKQLDQDGGLVKLVYNQNNDLYSIVINTKTKGILKLFGDRQISSDGYISKNGFKPVYFDHKNKINPKKNIQSKFLYDLKKIDVTYKGEVKQYDLGNDYLDLATFLFQFNFKKKKQKEYLFNVVEGKKMQTFKYKFIKDQTIAIKNQKIKSELFEGKVNNKEKSKHYIWISKQPYRLPIKVKMRTDFGLMLDFEMHKNNLF